MGSGIAGTSSSSCAELSNEEEERKLVELVEGFDVDWGSDLEVKQEKVKFFEKFSKVDTEIPSLESQVSWDILKHLKPKEKKRQEVINELYQTGKRTHIL